VGRGKARGISKRQKRALAAKRLALAPPAPPPPPVVASRNGATRKPPSQGERFFKHLINVLGGVVGVGAAPMAAHALAGLTTGEAIGWVPQEAYLLSLVLWGGAFYEVRCMPEERLAAAWQRVYHHVMHWLSPTMAFAMALAYGYIEAQNEHTKEFARFLAGTAGFGVFLALAAYFVLKVPLMHADAKEECALEER
jgi:hypothetical protein